MAIRNPELYLRGLSPAIVVLLAALVLLLIPHLGRLPLWLSLLLLGLIGWRFLHDAGRLRLPGRVLRILVVITGIFGILNSFHSLIGREAGTALLLFLMVLKLMEMHNRRDITVVIFLGYFMVVLSFLFSQSILNAAYLLLVLLVLLFAQIYLSHPVPSAQAWPYFTSHFKLAIRFVLLAMPLAMLLFVFFPRVSAPLWGLPENVLSARTGLSEEVSPGRISQLSNNEAVAFRVKFDGDVPPAHLLYWRGIVHWYYDGRSWTTPTNQRMEMPSSALKLISHGSPVKYTITLDPHDKHWMFALDTPGTVPEQAQITVGRQFLATKPIHKLSRYEATSYLRYRYETERPMAGRTRYLQLAATTAPRSRQLIERLRLQYPNDVDLVNAVLNYFRDEPFYYTRNAPLLFDDPVDEFLFDSRRGFCEHYASSFTVMMRQAGIPARVVSGYQGGEMNPLSDYMIVRQADAHAWSEVWLNEQGWVRIDPTSVIPPGRIENDADVLRRQPQTDMARKLLEKSWFSRGFHQARYAWDAMNNQWNQWIVGFNQKRQAAMFSALGVPNIEWQGLTTVLAISTLIVIGVIAWRLFRLPKHPADPVQQAYQQFCKRLARVGVEKQPQETPARFAQRVELERSDLVTEVDTITGLYLQLRYGKVTTPELMQQLVALVRQFRPPRQLTHS